MSVSSVFTSVFDVVFGRRRRLGDRRSVLLTFDDGPDPDVTPAVLDRLKSYSARALFFVVGSRIHKAPQLLDRILSEGHLIGNHTFEHRLETDPGFLAYYFDVRRSQAMLRHMTGQAPKFFRAPMGRRSAGALLTPRLLGLRHILWSVDSDDWKLRTEETAQAGAQRLCECVRSGDIVLLHDDNPWVLTVLDVLLPHLASRDLDLNSGLDML